MGPAGGQTSPVWKLGDQEWPIGVASTVVKGKHSAWATRQISPLTLCVISIFAGDSGLLHVWNMRETICTDAVRLFHPQFQTCRSRKWILWKPVEFCNEPMINWSILWVPPFEMLLLVNQLWKCVGRAVFCSYVVAKIYTVSSKLYHSMCRLKKNDCYRSFHWPARLEQWCPAVLCNTEQNVAWLSSILSLSAALHQHTHKHTHLLRTFPMDIIYRCFEQTCETACAFKLPRQLQTPYQTGLDIMIGRGCCRTMAPDQLSPSIGQFTPQFCWLPIRLWFSTMDRRWWCP